jgi:hypothetical protein
MTWNAELVARLEAERLQKPLPPAPHWSRPASRQDIAELVRAVYETNREGKPRRRRKRR